MKLEEKIKSNPPLAIFITLLVVLLIILTTSLSIFTYNSEIKQISLISDYGTKNSDITTIKTYNKNSYEINPLSKPLNIEESNENGGSPGSNNNAYNTISSYMEKFELDGEGTLTLKKGTYIVDRPIYIPSNVNIILEDGAIIKKIEYVGSEDLNDSNHLFELVEPNKSKTPRTYGEYNGVHDVNIVGKGESIIDLGYIESEIAIVMAHNKNINIQGITFKNLNNGHFMELDASYNVTVTKSSFLDSNPSPKLNKEAINIDTPDKSTKGFRSIWTQFDKTPNKNVLIKNNTFNNLDRAIGTHKYSQDTYNGQYTENKSQKCHENIIIKNNKISNMRTYGIKTINWKDSQIINNYIDNTSNNKEGIKITGDNITIKFNYFSNMQSPVQFSPTKNRETGEEYNITYNFLTSENKINLHCNFCNNTNSSFAKIYNTYNNFDNSENIGMFVSIF